MKRLLAYLFLFIYLLNQAVYALPVINSAVNRHEFKKKCKYGRNDKLSHKSSSDQKAFSHSEKKSDKKVVSICFIDVHSILESYFSLVSPEPIIHQQVNRTQIYSCSTNIHSPPPCLV